VAPPASDSDLTFSDYSVQARATAVYPRESAVVYPALGLAGEAGEVAGKLSKVLRDHEGRISDAQTDALLDELGDVLWFLDALARDLGRSLTEAASRNLTKLASRQARGTLQGSGDVR
jgi:NTP pyrophosphatase (non-canonical NTP hydrolase)